jgi:alkylation response protein AidB-like acyl-CoA dehydrogenase
MHEVVARVRRFVEEEVRPAASALEHADEYPHHLVARMKSLGLFGCLVPPEHGGLGLDVATYACVIEELCRGWMSLAGVINSHTMMALIVLQNGTDEQRRHFLPSFATGTRRGGLCLTEPHAGSDVQAIRTIARRDGDHYVIDGAKMFVTNGREGNSFALLARTEPHASPAHRGMSCFVVEKGGPGFHVVKSIGKLGYKGVDTAELVFEGFRVPAANLVGGVEGRGFKHVMSGLETGRINIAARSVGVAQAAFDEALGWTHSHGASAASRVRLAEMATRLTAARLVTYWAARMKDSGERCDLEAGMAKLYATEAAQAVALDAMRVHGGEGYLRDRIVERHYRDTPLMIIGEGTNEIQRLLIARQLLERYGERLGALRALDDEPEERRQMVLAVRAVVQKAVVPVASEHERVGAYPLESVEALRELGVFGANVPQEYGGLGLDEATIALLLEELARGSMALACVLDAHLAVSGLVGRWGTAAQRERSLPALTRGDRLAAIGFAQTIGAGGRPAAAMVARRDGDAFVLDGRVVVAANGEHGRICALLAPTSLVDGAAPSVFIVETDAAGIAVSRVFDTLGARGAGAAELTLSGVRVPAASLLGDVEGHGNEQAAAALRWSRVWSAARGVGLAQAAFEAALRYSQQRSAFGKPICQHQAIQLKLADMATGVTVARLLTHHAAIAAGDGGEAALMARLFAASTACDVSLESMRVHGGYGYTAEFPVERFYRDAPRLALVEEDLDEARLELAGRLLHAAPAARGEPETP